MGKLEDYLVATLKDKKTVVTKAIFWKIPHKSQKEDIHLKLGRYKKHKQIPNLEFPENADPKSELTLDNEEFVALITFLKDNYEPFRQGAKAFIPLDRPFEKENAEQLKALFSLPERKGLFDFIVKNRIIPGDLELALQHVRRVRAIRQFENMLESDLQEQRWEEWFQKNDWVLGSDFVRVLDERNIDTSNISDFLMEAYDGFLDIIEIKRPEGNLKFWGSTLDHGNYVPSQDLVKAVTQASRYIYELEREANSIKFLEKVGGVKTVKPRCILVFGRSNIWNQRQQEALRILNAGYHNLTVMTYDHVAQRAKRMVGVEENS